MKIGSLFDGSGTAPLAAAMCGIEPVWASEIEPYPIKVTKARFPGMKHLGSILDINGADVEPVDIICGGSPCQDLSMAGKQKGLIEGERSHLFFEMTRIIKEMRDSTNGKYPRYVIWENVPGAFSSNNGYDFLAVLQAFAQIADPNVYVPRPACKGKTDRLAWQYAGTIMGDGYSIAWRTVDAQYWGVPQRRRRIYLVADLRGERAGEILFEREGVSGNPEPRGTQREETAGNAGSGTDRSGGTWSLSAKQQSLATEHETGATLGANDFKEPQCIVCLNDQGGNIMNTSVGVTGTLRAQEHGHQPVLCLQANGIDRADTAGCNGAGWRENESYTLNTIDRHAVVYAADIRNGVLNKELSATLQSKNSGGYSLNYQNPVLYPFDMQAFGTYGNGETSSSLKQRDYKDATDLVVEDCRIYPGVGITSKQNASNPMSGDPAPTLSTDSRNYLVSKGKQNRKYIVRRLTSLECCRLQGFPDYWTEGIERYPAHNVPQYVDPTGAVEGSDSAKYKMWGNGMALPNMLHVMRGIVRCENEDRS